MNIATLESSSCLQINGMEQCIEAHSADDYLIEEAWMYMKKHEEFPEKELKAVRKGLTSGSSTYPIAVNQGSLSFQPSAARDQRISSDAKQYTPGSVSRSYLIRASSSEESAGDVEEGESADKIAFGGSIQVVLKTDKKDELTAY
ncbi:hypothetical protein OCU04_013193 [Sclerotinia nivalis]|uniref:Uncharacterized protein n=1 Tax=Sclerotinia nivalis TaxID=352851 RepID=A0A9X0DD12_9HELO|nr:hypothetical protein OCU04_013193 [Sclerotinia nivalis]